MIRRGAILLEVLLSLALFVGAAGFTLGTVRNVLTAIDRSGREAFALDLARSKLAELEAGLVTVAELRDARQGIDGVGSVETFEERPDQVWLIDVTTSRTEHGTLSLIELTVTESLPGLDMGFDGGFDAGDTGAVRCTLRQLMALRDDEADAYEEDRMLEGLPMEPAP